jgi:hypothetical protein
MKFNTTLQIWNPYGALCDSCVDPYCKTMEFYMKNLYECTRFPYLGWGAKKRRKKSRLKNNPPKEFSYAFQYGFHMEHSTFFTFTPTELPDRFQYGFHREHSILPTTIIFQSEKKIKNLFDI